MFAPADLAAFPRRHRWAAAVLLGAVGFALNLRPLSLSPGTDLLFGTVPALLAAIALGPAAGAAAGGIAAARTLWLWSHPWAWAIFTLEAVAVGFLARRFRRRLLVADLIFWVAAGLPLLFLTYWILLGFRGATAAVIFLKQPFNGLICALAAEALLLLPGVRRVLGIPGAPQLRSALAVVVALSATLPALAFGVWTGRREWDRNLERTRERLVLVAGAHAGRLEQYVGLHERAVRALAEGAERSGRFDAEQLRRLVAVERAEFPGFVSIYAADARGRAVAFEPAAGPEGRPTVGTDFSDRPYYRELVETRRTVVSEVFPGRGGVDEPLVVIAHPIVLADTLAGYVLGALDLKAIPAPTPAPSLDERLVVADSVGTVVFDSRAPYRPGVRPRSVRDSLSFAAVSAVGAEGTTTFESRGPRAPAARNASRMLAGVAFIRPLHWRVWVEEPFAEIQAFVADSYVRLLALLIAVTLLALSLGNLLSAYLARPLLRMREATAALGAGNPAARVGPLSAAVPTEIAALGRDFDQMAEALVGRTEELEELGEIARSLASTLEPGEVLRRVTDAAVRLVDPDGCGIALVDPGGRTLRAADYTLGLLEEVAGREFDMDDSIVGWVAREGEPVLVRDVAADARVRRAYLDPERTGSMVCAPLLGRSGPLGALTCVRARGNPVPFTEGDLRLLERLARHAAVAVENAQLLEAAQAASRAKSDFIATMSHELRTPLNAVLGHLQLLEMEIHGPVTDRQREALGRIEAASRHLRGLIEEVLSFARLEAGRVETRVEETDLCALASEVAAVIEPLATGKRLGFAAELCEPRAAVPTDPDKVRQVLINLAGNAVKFTEAGEVRISVRERGEEVLLSVRDTGPGIAPEDRERLFRPFEQLESGFSRSHGGTGLGLYLSGQYAELLGGRIEVESEIGSGSTFSLVLPREGPPARDSEGGGDDRRQAAD